ncbi:MULTISPECIES: antA/AntB antirepressor family protein [Acinetobacter]|uniref:AntA/AntB antirepressor family protein n=1 Tax=Acinetobacter entericus TaxID=2989714 RepID=A0ABT3NN94_9GAMM|nr:MULTISPECIES: antA/AntB antirepressor family protein [Acinetobacter]MCW8041037.1 antA/AntB antirepressor family protein [Acinetobacter entericus]MDQ8974625.1 antA/AntB antirepressor family protein [Acinetobacter johnsonii]
MNAITNFEAETPLVEIEIGGELQLGVDARSLHKTLGSKQDFSTWIKRRISQCQFRENFDFILLHQKVEQVSGTKHLVEYIVTADMAKHLGLMEKTPQGHQIREYFIQQEKVARSVAHSIQVEVGKAMQYFEQFNASLSNAARFLSVGGKQTKPKLLSDLEKLLKKAQPRLPFDGEDEE